MISLRSATSPIRHFWPILLSGLLLSACAGSGSGQGRQPVCTVEAVVCDAADASGFALIAEGLPATLILDEDDFEGVAIAAGNLQEDLARLGGSRGGFVRGDRPPELQAPAILIGTLGHSDAIDSLVAEGKLDVSAIAGAWEGYLTTVVDRPMEGVSSALVIVGSDQRGTIFGIYDLVSHAGVSPWSWWADVPVPHRPNLVVTPDLRSDKPSVRYRGIFLNDENPALYDWVHATYGGFNKDFYARVFELIQRLKGNYLWPAMWGKAFYDDDAENGLTAQRYGMIIGTSHHEPLMRAHVEWERYGEGPWDYTRNAEALRKFWRGGIERIAGQEALVTIGMRGDGDEAMTEGTAIALLETIVADQRAIIADVTGAPAEEQPQVWALYKEVQDYYDQGMQVPDDVLLLFADDNWGNIRRLPDPGSQRPGGYGVYYHFDYVGAPRNYKWINVSQIERIWEQMHLARSYGADRLWVVNVGDLKPMELPISFFLEQAWNPEAMTLARMDTYTTAWAARQFGTEHAAAIAALLDGYTRFNSRRTPELLDASTYSLLHFDEWERVAADYRALADEADRIRELLPPEHDDAFVQLVWYPVKASSNLYALYHAVARNHLYAEQGRVEANAMADLAEDLFAYDGELTRIYHEDIADGKWTGMMGQVHIGYTYWQQPDAQSLPEVRRIEPASDMPLGVAVSGSEKAATGTSTRLLLPEFSPYSAQRPYIEVFNRGTAPFTARMSTGENWLSVSETDVAIDSETKRIGLAVDWSRVPTGRTLGRLQVESAGQSITIEVPVFRPPEPSALRGFVEADGVISIPASDYDRAQGSGPVQWTILPDLGRRGSAIAAFPRPHESFVPGPDTPRLEYDLHTFTEGEVTVHIALEPTFDVAGKGGTRFAVSLNDGPPVVVNANDDLFPNDYAHPVWPEAVASSALVRTAKLTLPSPGAHTLKLWLIDPGLVFQEIWIETGDMPRTYLGPPTSHRVRASAGSQ